MILEHPYFSEFLHIKPTTPAELYISTCPNDFLDSPIGIKKFTTTDVLEQWRGVAVNPELDPSQITRMLIRLDEESFFLNSYNSDVRTKFMEVVSELLAHKNLSQHLIKYYICFGPTIDVFDNGFCMPNAVIINPALTPEHMDLFFTKHVQGSGVGRRTVPTNTVNALLVQMQNSTPEMLEKWFRGVMYVVGYSGLIDITAVCTINERCPHSVCDYILTNIFDNSYFGANEFQTALTPVEKQALLQILQHKNSSKELSDTLRRKILAKFNDIDFSATEALELFIF